MTKDNIDYVNDNDLYRSRKYNHATGLGDRPKKVLWDYFGKAKLPNVEYEKLIAGIETTQQYSDKFYCFLPVDTFDENNTRGWNLPNKSIPGKWRNQKIKNNIISFDYTVSTASAILKGNILLYGGNLYQAEIDGIYDYLYGSQLVDTIEACIPQKARLTKQYANFNLFTLLEFTIDCIQKVFDDKKKVKHPLNREYKLSSEFSEIFEIIKSLLPIAKEVSSIYNKSTFMNIDFQFFVDKNYNSIKLELYKHYDVIHKHPYHDYSVEGVLSKLIKSLYFGYLADSSPIADCRAISASTFERELSEKGFHVPSISEVAKDKQSLAILNRVSFAGHKKELEWQVDHFVKSLN